ncbi:MAG: RNA polymerase sigma factor [Planctomycetota bacterium]|nr:MAG: RNA polymerase sigma factor [Planctomycetota bacterium]
MKQVDLKLVLAAQDGDRDAFGRLMDLYKGRIYAMSLAITGDRDEAQELTQETFVRALQGLPKLSSPERFPSWLRGIARTAGQDARRKAARERKHALAAGERGARRASPTPSEEVSARELAQADRAQLEAQLAALSSDCRLALDLRFGEDLSYAEIARVLGVPVSTVRGLLYRGTKTLRERMRPHLARTRGKGDEA